MTKIKCPICEHTNDAARRDCVQCGAPLPKVRVHGSGPRSDASPQPHERAPGQSTFRRGQVVANRYTILDVVGKGGMGCIYRVHDNTLKEQVALKTLLPQYLRDKMVVDRFFNEARIARQLSHPSIVRVHDIGMADQVLYISMEYLHGKSLRNMLEELLPGERLPVKDTLRIMIDLCGALEYAHQYTVHRDLKPENIMILPDGTLKLMDFGISKLMTTGKMTATAVVMGTPHYMPPEQFRDSSTVDVRADIYSIGVILYEILTGNLPTGVPKPASQILRDVPPALDPIIAKCVEPQPADRYANVAELKHALMEVAEMLRGGTLESKKAVKARPRASGDLLRRALGGLLIVAVAFVAAVGVWGLEGRRARLIAQSSINAVADPAESVGRQWRQRYEQAAALLSLAERRTANRERMGGDKAIFDRIKVLGDAAKKNETARPELAAKLAHQALQCYTALVKPLPDDSYFLVLPGDVGQDAFYMSRHEVTLGEYTAWANSANWPVATVLAGPDQPIGTYAYYDAEAYAAAHSARLPSREEWQRAFAEQPNMLITALPEWTRSIAGADDGGASTATFGNELITVAVAVDENSNAMSPTFGQTPYFSTGQSVGFRCAVPIDTRAEEMQKLFSP